MEINDVGKLLDISSSSPLGILNVYLQCMTGCITWYIWISLSWFTFASRYSPQGLPGMRNDNIAIHRRYLCRLFFLQNHVTPYSPERRRIALRRFAGGFLPSGCKRCSI